MAAQPANTRNAQGTGFTNYNDVLNANQTSGQGLGDIIGQGLQSQAGAVKQNVQNQTDQFNTGVQNANNQYSNVADLAKYYADQGAQGNYSGIASGPTGQTVDPTTAGATFQAYNYNGPTGLKDASGLTSQAQSASDVGRQAGSAQGQQALLKQYVAGNNNYTQGEGQFDQALLNKYGQGQINQGRQALSNIGTTAQNAITGATGQAQTAANSINADKKSTLGQLQNIYSGTDGTGGLIGVGKTQGDTYGTNAQAVSAAINQATSDPTQLTPEQVQLLSGDLSQYGIDPTQKFDTRNASLANNALKSYFTPSGDIGASRFNTDQLGAVNNLSSFLAGANGTTAAPVVNSATPAFNTANFNTTGITSEDTKAQQAAQQNSVLTQQLINSIISNPTYQNSDVSSLTQQLAPQGTQTNPYLNQLLKFYGDVSANNGAKGGGITQSQQQEIDNAGNQLSNYYNTQSQNLNNTISGGTKSVQDYINSLLNSRSVKSGQINPNPALPPRPGSGPETIS